MGADMGTTALSFTQKHTALGCSKASERDSSPSQCDLNGRVETADNCSAGLEARSRVYVLPVMGSQAFC